MSCYVVLLTGQRQEDWSQSAC